MTSKKKTLNKQTGDKSKKYTPEVVQAICDAIAKDGGCQSGWEAGGIGKTTFFEWKKKHPDFANKIAQAEKEFRENCPAEQNRQAKKAFNDYLFGRVKEVWTTEEIIDDPEKGRIVKTSTKTVTRGTPKWAIDRVLGANMEIVEIIKSLCELGRVTPEQARIAEELLGSASSRALDTILSDGSDDVCDAQ